jgi:hypothetical protein
MEEIMVYRLVAQLESANHFVNTSNHAEAAKFRRPAHFIEVTRPPFPSRVE